MGIEAESLARVIGARVNQERKGRNWTLDQLAEFAGVSRRMLVNVEKGSVNPSVGTLLRLSDALGVGLPALVEPPEPVSYTHLDVYKRQLVENGEPFRDGAGQGVGHAISSSIFATYTGSVSYTHLDVYKRQSLWCSTRVQRPSP